ncbi:hypothetical protein KY335_05645, partial [Candidatus Woesearchaeota archaeon]|nr:hypothetical protein [Candidatus Woesearchaeota archaeon]
GYLVLANTNRDDGEDNDFTDRYNFSADFEFTGSLSNTGETVVLYNANNSMIDSVSYDPGTEGYSLEYYNQEFVESLVLHGTPGSQNQFVGNESPVIPILENETNSTNQANTTNATNSTNAGCDFSIDILLDKEVYENKEKISYELELSQEDDDKGYDFQIEYYIEDLSGEIIRAKRNTTTPGTKSFTPSIKEADKIFFIKAQVYSFCNETNLTDNYDSAIVVVRNSAFEDEDKEDEAEEGKEENEAEKEDDGGSKTVSKKAEIESFYTRHKIFEEGRNISLYAMLYNPAGEANFDVALLNNGVLLEDVEIPINAEYKKRWNISVILEPGLNNFSIVLSRYSEKEDFKSLEIFAEPIEENSKAETLVVKNPLPEKQENVSTMKTYQTKTKDAEEEKEKSIVQYIILGISVALNSLLIWKR